VPYAALRIPTPWARWPRAVLATITALPLGLSTATTFALGEHPVRRMMEKG
jgi:hypothetical protein